MTRRWNLPRWQGLHRSGTSILAELLKSHPKIAGHQIEGMPPELENEGQEWQYKYM